MTKAFENLSEKDALFVWRSREKFVPLHDFRNIMF